MSNNGDKMDTLSECMNHAKAEGYLQDFTVLPSGIMPFNLNVEDMAKAVKIYKPEDVSIKAFFRFEGSSDPGDNSILYLIETNDGLKGMIVDGYGPTANPKIGEFIKRVEEIQKTLSKDE